MKPNKRFLLAFALIKLLIAVSNEALALENDADQPITIDSNTATYDDKAQLSIYTGDVISIQGSIRVNSDKLTVYFVDGEVDKLVFTGNPAHFKQTPKEGKEDITGESLIGEYYPKKNLLIMKQNAIVRQGTGTYASEFIEYDIKTSLVKAGEKRSDAKRVHVILKPKNKK